MGKGGKLQKQRHQQKPRRGGSRGLQQFDDDDSYSYTVADQHLPTNISTEEEEEEEEEEEDSENGANPPTEIPSKFHLYQKSVQSPKGDISYMLKFFLMYVGGRLPLHMQEDFCGTALLSTEWLRSDPRRTAIGLDLDLEALNWCLENNVNKVGSDVADRISLFHGNVLQPLESRLVKFDLENLARSMTLEGIGGSSSSAAAVDDECLKKNLPLPSRDIVCAFNYSCCCLHKRGELIRYFKHVLKVLSKKGGIFVMDLYGGTSSECKLKLQRRFPSFMYVWQQDDFDIIQRRTRISLHYHLYRQQKKLRNAFSYSWRLWSLPEIKDCLEEAGFQSIHFWIRNTPDIEDGRTTEGFGVGREVKYEEVTSFQQQDAWNAYIVGVAN